MFDISQAVCKDADPEMFFSNENDIYLHAEEARVLCRICPVQAECLRFALENDEQGIWGGTDERDRKALSQGRALPRRNGSMSPEARREQYLRSKKRKEVQSARNALLLKANKDRQGLSAEKSARIINALIAGGDAVPEKVRIVAELRLNNPEKSLTELADSNTLGLNKDQIAGILGRLIRGGK
jgi:WhiB family redox-sensing transcriptional regulator